MITAICPGSFDPVTVGHVDIITRAAAMFDRVIVAVMHNFDKKHSFTAEERIALLKRAVDLPNVEVEAFGGLLAEYAQQKGATVLVKGLRALSDFEYEFQQALINKKLNPDLETVFLTTRSENMYLSSSVVKQIATLGGDISGFVPESLIGDIQERFYQKEANRL
ncbi:MAG: pantetheine-phosphate adenylyltransferase [Clostridiales bacterium]|nr:pantetheine-phosphate adenylyltransferase [Clostridiales bacterium]